MIRKIDPAAVSKLACLTAILLAGAVFATTAKAASGPYLGQILPGTTPTVFASGIISLASRSEGRITFSPDGTECYYTVMNTDWTNLKTYYTHIVGGVWTSPAVASFSSSIQTGEPFFSSDGNKLYYTNFDNYNIYVMTRTTSGWSIPMSLSSPINSSSVELHYSQAANGTACFVSNRSGGYGGLDLYQTYLDSSQTLKVKNLGSPMNTAYNDRDPCIAPDGSYLIFSSARATSGIYGELYVSYNNGNGGWTAPVNMNTICAGINIVPGGQFTPSLSPDGRHLFFSRETGIGEDIYWVANPLYVPEPATVIQLGLAAMLPGLAGIRRLRRRILNGCLMPTFPNIVEI
jgi:Tol biopolymer transport system component